MKTKAADPARRIRAEVVGVMRDEALRAMRLERGKNTPDLDKAIEAYLALPPPGLVNAKD